MALSDADLIAEVRVLTDYTPEIMSDREFQDLVDLTKRELRADLNQPGLDFYSDLSAERCLFWLVCIFAKVRAGEIDSPSFSISELKVRQSNFTERVGIWFDNFWNHYHSVGGGPPRGHIKSSRPDRTYNFDN